MRYRIRIEPSSYADQFVNLGWLSYEMPDLFDNPSPLGAVAVATMIETVMVITPKGLKHLLEMKPFINKADYERLITSLID